MEPKRVIMWLVGGVGFLGAALTVIGTDEIEKRWQCHVRMSGYLPAESVMIRVPEEDRSKLLGYVHQFSAEYGLIVSSISRPVQDGAHSILEIELCNLTADINISNTFVSSQFGVHVTRNSRRSVDEFETLRRAFLQGLASRFAFVPQHTKAPGGTAN